MESIPERLKAHMEFNPLDTGDPNCGTALDQIGPMPRATRVTRRRFRMDSGNWKPLWNRCPCRITTLFSTFAAGFALTMKERRSLMACGIAWR